MATPDLYKYDFLQLVVYDVHCRALGRLIGSQGFQSATTNGAGIYGAMCYFGMQGQPCVAPYFGVDVKFRNSFMHLDMSTLTTSHEGKGRVGHVLCDLIDVDGKSTSPRTVALRQLDRLKRELDLTILSASELEFDLFHNADTSKPFGHDQMWASINQMDMHQDLLLEFLDALKITGVKVDSLMTEFGPGMYEMTCDLEDGIRGPDTIARFKNVAKSFFKKRGLTATFMTRPVLLKTSSGMHFNHSLWTQDGKNALYDPREVNTLSKLGQNWLAGLVKHARAITALCCPTINCYRRIGCPWAPDTSSWGMESRLASFRLKVEGSNVYMENRIPSAASNPYLVMAATVAAGMDGVLNKLPLPAETETFLKLPRSLDEAIGFLEADDVIVKALGPDVIKYFIDCKREFELKPFNVPNNKDPFIEELKMYLENA